jgi:protoporphyrinogen oxidase
MTFFWTTPQSQKPESRIQKSESATTHSVAVIGGGPMGLATAHRLAQEGSDVTVFETDDRLGGMSAAFDFAGTPIERFYHFICKPDKPLFTTLEELGIADSLNWVSTSMGLFHKDKVHLWGRPDALLRFPHLDLLSKIRYGLFALKCSKIQEWTRLDKMNAITWLKAKCGEKGYELLWRQLIESKFFEYSDHLSAAWIASRVRRVGLSRTSIFQETLGYLQGGSQVLIDAWETEIRRKGGTIRCSTKVEKLIINKDGEKSASLRALGVQAGEKNYYFDQIVSTIPLPYVLAIAPELSFGEQKMIRSIKYVGVRCVLLKLKHQLLPHFWTNISDSTIPTPGFIEYTNLRPLDSHIVYAPFYLPHNHPRYATTDQELVEETYEVCKKLNPRFEPLWVEATRATRYHYAQTVCPPNFFAAIPPIRTSIEGFYMADTSYYYPEDRSISESIALGEILAKTVLVDEGSKGESAKDASNTDTKETMVEKIHAEAV